MIGDIALRFINSLGFADISLEDRELIYDNGFDTAVLISLFTDLKVDNKENLPDNSNYQGGWWGDIKIGSKLWLLRRSKSTEATIQDATNYCKAALQWFIDEGIVEYLECTVSKEPGSIMLIDLKMYSPINLDKNYKFYYNWKEHFLTGYITSN